MHNNTNSIYFSHFWSNIKSNKWQINVHPPCSAKKVVHALILQHFHAERRHDARLMLKKICCTITHITEMQHCPTKCSKVDDIRIRLHNTHAIRAVKVIVWSYVTRHDSRPPHPLPACKWNFPNKNDDIAHLRLKILVLPVT